MKKPNQKYKQQVEEYKQNPSKLWIELKHLLPKQVEKGLLKEEDAQVFSRLADKSLGCKLVEK